MDKKFGGICELCGDEVGLITLINRIHCCKICAAPIIALEMLDPRRYEEKHPEEYPNIRFLLYYPRKDYWIITPLGFKKYVFYANTLYRLIDPRVNNPPHWYQLFKEQIKRINNYRCSECNSTEDLQVHHVVRVKVETSKLLDLDNVMLLCRDCHSEEHRKAQLPFHWDGSWDSCPLCGGNKKSCYEICYNCSEKEGNYY